MSEGLVIESISETLVSLLERGIENLPSGRFSVSLKSPAEEIEDDAQRISLFLYSILENTELRNQPWIKEGNNHLRYPPLFLNLHYLITPYARDQKDVHRIMTETMRILHDYSSQDFPGIEKPQMQLRIVLEPFPIEDIHKIWRALNRPYRLSVSYCVQVARIESTRSKTIEAVKERDIRLHQIPIRKGG